MPNAEYGHKRIYPPRIIKRYFYKDLLKDHEANLLKLERKRKLEDYKQWRKVVDEMKRLVEDCKPKKKINE